MATPRMAAHPCVVDFTVGGQNAGETGTCSPNADCTTNASGVVEFTHTVPVRPIARARTPSKPAWHRRRRSLPTVEKNWADTTPPEVSRREFVNPHGKVIPPAGRPLPDPRAARTRRLLPAQANDDVWLTADRHRCQRAGVSGGRRCSGDVIKYTQADTLSRAARRSAVGRPGSAVVAHRRPGDAVVTATDGSATKPA
jgi:hypothetical protein